MINPIKPVPFEDQYLDQTLSFLSKFSPDHPELGSRELFLWQKCKRFLTFSGGRIVGHMALIPQQFFIDGVELTIGWGATLVLDMSDFAIKTFAGTALLECCFKDPSYAYAGVGIVPEIEPAYKRLNYVVCRESVKMYARFYNPGVALKYYDKSSMFSIPMKVLNLLKRTSTNPLHGQLSEISQFDKTQDSLWQKLLSSQYTAYGERKAAFLNYKMSQPGKKYFAYIHENPAGQIDGYIILREARHNTRNLHILKICELTGTTDSKLDLLTKATSMAEELKVDGVVAVSSSRDSATFKRAGLWLQTALPIGVKPELAGKMHLTFFDSDLDNLW
jgi:hypothetical protein